MIEWIPKWRREKEISDKNTNEAWEIFHDYFICTKKEGQKTFNKIKNDKNKQ